MYRTHHCSLFVTTVFATAVALSGCVPSNLNYARLHAQKGHYTGSPNRSEALNVAVATGLTECHDGDCQPLSDVAREKLPASMRNATNFEIGNALMSAVTLGQGIGQMTGAISVITGVGNLVGGLMTIGTLFLGPAETDDPATVGTLIAWMPRSMAGTRKQARDKLMALVSNAAPDGSFKGYDVVTEPYPNTEDPGYHNYYNIFFRGPPDCSKPRKCNIMLFFSLPERTKTAPAWLDYNGPTYTWMNWGRGQTYDTRFSVVRVNYGGQATEMYEGVPMPDRVNSRLYLLQVSENLPSWVYIYLPPDKFADYPVMLNDGEMLLFIEPKSGASHGQAA